mmetsp:Transcript_60091/g.122599  ORF Transcript_60091/g.122599 Transcript_60091/m.122599 type:complete len:80 (+) Transcript_60091:176-415(+)
MPGYLPRWSSREQRESPLFSSGIFRGNATTNNERERELFRFLFRERDTGCCARKKPAVPWRFVKIGGKGKESIEIQSNE